jgi:hypothetical protein
VDTCLQGVFYPLIINREAYPLRPAYSPNTQWEVFVVTVLVPCRNGANGLMVSDHRGGSLQVIGNTEVFEKRRHVVAKLIDSQMGFDLVEFADGKKAWVNPVPFVPNSQVQA